MDKGDHIKIYRGGYWHHGICVEEGYVVHFTNKPKGRRDAKITKTTLKEFIDGDGEPIVVSEYKTSRMAHEVASTALSLVGVGGYNLFSNNCEHFAYYCSTGSSHNYAHQYVDQIAGIAIDICSTNVPIIHYIPFVGNLMALAIGVIKVSNRMIMGKLVYLMKRFSMKGGISRLYQS